ncbi:MAG: hypothetical protein IH624_14375 [Phycisphaerae bacterium]|nr:hypothetical protein [Phycisphaerae bacterium]
MGIDKTSYEWLFLKRHPSWLRGRPFRSKFYRELIGTENDARADFSQKLRVLALELLQVEDDIGELQRALCVLSVVGKTEDIPAVEKLHQLDNADLSTDVGTCIYEIRQGKNV